MRVALLAALAAASAGHAAASDVPVTNIVLAGAYGNLAGKYLWKSLFSLYLDVDRSDTPGALKIYAAGRDPQEKGWPKVEEFFDTKLKCGPEHEKHGCTPVDIANFRSAMGGIEYVQLKSNDHYEALCSAMNAAGGPERGRMFYLSVPPFAYADLAKTIAEKCTPPDANSFLRVAFEKPFGSDLASADVLAKQLAAHLREDQIYRVDHYLGKRGVQQILDYRLAAPGVNALLNAEHVAAVNVVMTEEEGCDGRTKFYDEYGVVRDIHQNHLTEVLCLLGMDTGTLGDGDPVRALKAKADFLRSFEDAELEHSVLGQYEDYVSDCQLDRDNHSYTTRTPTYAAVSLRAKSGPWEGVPVLVVSGKRLGIREAYVEVQFKGLTVPPGEKLVQKGPDADRKGSIVFHIQGGEPTRGPEVRVGKVVASQPGVNPAPAGAGWTQAVVWPELEETGVAAVYVPGVEGKPDLPYDRLMLAMYEGSQDLFVGTAGLMESWRLWDPLLQESADAGNDLAEPHLYPAGSNYQDVIHTAATEYHRVLGHIHEDL